MDSWCSRFAAVLDSFISSSQPKCVLTTQRFQACWPWTTLHRRGYSANSSLRTLVFFFFNCDTGTPRRPPEPDKIKDRTQAKIAAVRRDYSVEATLLALRSSASSTGSTHAQRKLQEQGHRSKNCGGNRARACFVARVGLLCFSLLAHVRGKKKPRHSCRRRPLSTHIKGLPANCWTRKATPRDANKKEESNKVHIYQVQAFL